MKNKKNTYILLFIVLSIWGMVLYRFFSYSTPEIAETKNSNDFSIKPLVIKPKDTIALDVNYRDPFLGKMYMPVDKNKSSVKSKVKAKDPIIWPHVLYKGLVSDNKDKKKVFMLIINGKTYLMKEKDTEQGILLKNGDRYGINIKYKGEQSKIMIQE